MRPMEYAAKGYDDKKVSGPILVGEKGPEMIVPTGEGKISILPNKDSSRHDVNAYEKKAEKGADDIMTGRPEMPKLERIVTPEVKS